MTKEAALYNFYKQFLTPYEENTVPDNAELPYLTYNMVTGGFRDGECSLTVSIWYRDTSWAKCNAKAREIAAKIPESGVWIKCDDGAIWLKRGSPFAQNMSDDDRDIRRKYFNLTAEYVTTI